ncbi:hypothetical protein [Dactylosporangium sp. NPDC005555]|uniref:hypothetical protein n=1 Tax=Dactylosporangium sp. NPDC005555 TaxID=3154889 RepID=UPI00339EDD0A
MLQGHSVVVAGDHQRGAAHPGSAWGSARSPASDDAAIRSITEARCPGASGVTSACWSWMTCGPGPESDCPHQAAGGDVCIPGAGATGAEGERGDMNYYCDRCGYEMYYSGAMSQAGMPCRACRIGRYRHGQQPAGFSTDAEHRPVPRGLPVPAFAPLHQGTVRTPDYFNYFAGEMGRPYQELLRRHTTYVGKLTNILIQDPKQFAWLTPYTGNKHNRAFFTQLLLARVARAKFADNQGVLPRLIEPFVGSGQVFLNACRWSTAFNHGMPLFTSVVGGDLNHYVIGVYRGMQQIGAKFTGLYRTWSFVWDQDMPGNYQRLLHDLNTGGRAAMLNHTADPKGARLAACKYIWLVNRCTRGTKLAPNGGLVANLKPDAVARALDIRRRETRTLAALLDVLEQIDFDVEHRDFQVTCASATRQDIVFMDCPFPQFSLEIPGVGEPCPEGFGTTAANTYGTPGGDGPGFQTTIVNTALQLVRQGTTVIMCNFANPGLIIAYANLIGNDLAHAGRRPLIYTYRSPSTRNEAYQLTILPGAGNRQVELCPNDVRDVWLSAGGDDYKANEFFQASPHWTPADNQHQQRFDQAERRRQAAEPTYVFVDDVDDEEDYSDAAGVIDLSELQDGGSVEVDEAEDETMLQDRDEDYVDK